MKEESVETRSYRMQEEAKQLNPFFPLLPKEAFVDLEHLSHSINSKTESWKAARTIDSFVRHLTENGTPLSADQFVEIVRTYAHAEDIPLYAELFARAVKNDSGPGQGSR